MLSPQVGTTQKVYAHHEAETQLWQQFRQGSELAFEKLTNYFYRDLHFYGSRFTPDTDLLKDCLQDLFVDLWVYRHKVMDTDYIRPYLYKSLRRKIYREVTRQANHISDDTLPFDEVSTSDPTAEHTLIQTELSEYQSTRLNKLLERLSARQREAIHLKFYAELSNEEIADILSVNKQSVANLLHRGLSRLRDDWPSLLSVIGIWCIHRLLSLLQL
ncbi:RNA polymerase sigma factor, sigma-70 family [Spirosoma fluviale]|uniref:RNA polymerase sigma factor, sigma-70 family n=2 Tax=Spirosoma fluviale TaxID=1597977 RepID=A0A286FZP7_9BACT|nr:RNA polymerase sigma factor, sigma-70 family [Spirosoma fluviale]